MDSSDIVLFKEQTVREDITAGVRIVRYVIYEDFEVIKAKNKEELYCRINEDEKYRKNLKEPSNDNNLPMVDDWFSEYEETDPPHVSKEQEENHYFSDYRLTKCFSTIKPPNLISGSNESSSIKKNDQSRPSDNQSINSRAKEDQEARRPKLSIKQQYFPHIQRLDKFLADPTENDFTKLPICIEILKERYTAPYIKAENYTNVEQICTKSHDVQDRKLMTGLVDLFNDLNTK